MELRQRKLRQRHIGKLAGLNEKQLSMIMHGTRRMTAEEFLKLCMAGGIDPAIFLLCDELDGVRVRLELEQQGSRYENEQGGEENGDE